MELCGRPDQASSFNISKKGSKVDAFQDDSIWFHGKSDAAGAGWAGTCSAEVVY